MLSAKRDAGVRHVELSQELAEKTEELRASLKREEACLEDSETYKYEICRNCRGPFFG